MSNDIMNSVAIQCYTHVLHTSQLQWPVNTDLKCNDCEFTNHYVYYTYWMCPKYNNIGYSLLIGQYLVQLLNATWKRCAKRKKKSRAFTKRQIKKSKERNIKWNAVELLFQIWLILPLDNKHLIAIDLEITKVWF